MELERLNEEETCISLSQRLEEEKESYTSKQLLMHQKQLELSNADSLELQEKQLLNELKEQQTKKEENIQELEEVLPKNLELKRLKGSIKESNDIIQKNQKMQEECKINMEQWEEDVSETKLKKQRWMSEKEAEIHKISRVKFDASMPIVTIDKSEIEFEIGIEIEKPILSDEKKEILSLVYKWEMVHQTFENKSVELIRLEEQMKPLQEQEGKTIKLLEKHDKDWTQSNVPTIDLESLEEKEEKMWEKIESEKNTLQKLNSEKGILEAILNSLKEDIKKFAERIEKKHKRQAESLTDKNLEEREEEIKFRLEEETESNKKLQETLMKSKAILNEIDRAKGRLDVIVEKKNIVVHVPKEIKTKIANEIDKTVLEWIQKDTKIKGQLTKAQVKVSEIYKTQLEGIKEIECDEVFKDSIHRRYSTMDVDNVNDIQNALNEIANYIEFEREQQAEEKELAEQVKNDWVANASKFSMTVFDYLTKMINQMKIKNRNNHKFPLIKLSKQIQLPTQKEDVVEPLKDFFEKSVDDIFKRYQDIEEVPIRELKEKLSPSKIIYAALRHQFPKIMVYIMDTDNSFLCETPKESLYMDWETYNHSSLTQAQGSGGQLVAIQTLITMMLLNFKRQNEQDNRWMVLISDNPFANAISEHVIDPILAVADSLRFQWIVVCPPDYLKQGLTEKFGTWYSLGFEKQKSGRDKLIEQVEYGMRQFNDNTSILD